MSGNPSDTANTLIWHGMIREALMPKKPMLGVAIFDCCRDAAEGQLAELLKADALARRDRDDGQSDVSFVTAFGTGVGSRNYEYSTARSSQGLYLRFLLRHLGSASDSVLAVFEKTNESFTREVGQSVSSRMAPEFSSTTRQRMCLAARLRDSRADPLARKFFSLVRFEAQPGASAWVGDELIALAEKGCLSVEAGISKPFGSGSFCWVAGGEYQGLLRVSLSPSNFLNEARVRVAFSWECDDVFPSTEVCFQVQGCPFEYN